MLIISLSESGNEIFGSSKWYKNKWNATDSGIKGNKSVVFINCIGFK